MSTAFIHDRIFHIGGAEAVFFDLIREHIQNNKEHQDHVIYTLFSDKTTLTIDEQTFPVVTALPHWINNIFVRGSRSHTFLDLSEGHLIDETPLEDGSPHVHQAKIAVNQANNIFMSFLMRLRKWGVRILQKIFDYRNLIVCYPLLTRLLRNKIHQQQPQHIIISSFAAVKNIVPVGKVTKANVTLYLHSPMQYIWENYDEYIQKLATRQRLIFKPLASRLRKRDSKPRRYDTIYTNSQYTKQCALKYYFNKFSKTPLSPGNIIVKYPNIHETIVNTPVATEILDYYIYIGRLVRFSRETDLIIRLANEINIPLIVMGSGPDEDWLKSLAGDTITFIGQVSNINEKIRILSKARGLINLTKESCGMGTMEALALGVPVFGYNGGATPELVTKENSVLADTKKMEHLIEKFREFHGKEWEREKD